MIEEGNKRCSIGAERQFLVIDDLRGHRYLRHTIDVLLNHPFRDDLLALHAAVLVRGSQILSVGFNKPTKPKIVRDIGAHPNLTLHAEVDAINLCKRRDLGGCKIFVARVLKDGKRLAISCPCYLCQRVLSEHGIQRAIFTTYFPQLGELKIKAPFIKYSSFREHQEAA